MEDNVQIINEAALSWAKILVTAVYAKIEDSFDNVAIIFDEVAAETIYEEKITSNDDLLAIAKAGTYIRYIADDLIEAKHSTSAVDLEQILINGIDRKIEEDTIDPASEAEVEELIKETNDIMDDINTDENDPDENPSGDYIDEEVIENESKNKEEENAENEDGM